MVKGKDSVDFGMEVINLPGTDHIAICKSTTTQNISGSDILAVIKVVGVSEGETVQSDRFRNSAIKVN